MGSSGAANDEPGHVVGEGTRHECGGSGPTRFGRACVVVGPPRDTGSAAIISARLLIGCFPSPSHFCPIKKPKIIKMNPIFGASEI